MAGYIDAHMHVSPSGKWYESPSKPPLADAPEDLIAAMDKYGIEIGVIVPGEPEHCEFVLQCQTNYPDRLIGCAMVNPQEKDAPAQFQSWIEKGLKGLKFHPIQQQFPDTDYERLSPIIAKAGEMGVHVQIHCTPMFGLSTIDGVLRVALEHPSATIILLHAGLHRYLDLFPVSRAQFAGVLQNLYIDMSGTIGAFYHSPLWESFRWVMHQIGAEHLVFGSDFPAMDIGITLEALRALGFSKEEEQLILRENMARILGLSQ
jgi:hypothetical protein